MIKHLATGFTLLLSLSVNAGFGQVSAAVAWQFEAVPITESEKNILITATLAPGWHLYSQFMKEGGPIPTRFEFEPGDGYRFAGPMKEEGNLTRFYDDLFEIEVRWYADFVTFSRRVVLHNGDAVIKGKVEFMACNKEVCIPGEREFAIKAKR